MSDLELSENTDRLVQRIFPPEQHDGVSALLRARCGSGLPLVNPCTPESLERIRFAALKLSDGSLPQLERAVAIANIDWRDVLVAAGFGSSLSAHLDWFDDQVRD